MSAESKLLEKFYSGFWIYLSGIILFVIFIGILTVFRKRLVKGDETKSRRIYLGSLLVSLCAMFFFGFRLIPYLQDFEAAQNRRFEFVSGTVVDYGKAVNVGDMAGEIRYYYPIVMDGDGTKIKLDVMGTTLNESYEFVYLEHTKLAEILA